MTDRAHEEGWLRTAGTTTASFSIDVSEHESGTYALSIRLGSMEVDFCPFAANELRSLADIILSALPDDRAGLTVAPCASAGCESVAAAQRQRDAEICRQIHSTSRQRVELALLCAREIEAATD